MAVANIVEALLQQPSLARCASFAMRSWLTGRRLCLANAQIERSPAHPTRALDVVGAISRTVDMLMHCVLS